MKGCFKYRTITNTVLDRDFQNEILMTSVFEGGKRT